MRSRGRLMTSLSILALPLSSVSCPSLLLTTTGAHLPGVGRHLSSLSPCLFLALSLLAHTLIAQHLRITCWRSGHTYRYKT